VRDVLGVERLAADARAADEHVQPRQPFDRGVELRRVADVVAVGQVEDVHLGSAGTQTGRRGRADPARAAGHERAAPFEVVGVGHRTISIPFRTWGSTRAATTRWDCGDRISY